MPLEVSAPLGSSERSDAIIRALEEVDGLESVQIGPAVFSPHTRLECVPLNDQLKLTVPLRNGFRVFLLEHTLPLKEATGLCHRVLKCLQQTRLPSETVRDDASRSRPVPPTRPAHDEPGPSSSLTPSRLSRPPLVMASGLMRPPLPAGSVALGSDTFSPPLTKPPTAEEVLVEAENWANPQGEVEGLFPRLISTFGHSHEQLLRQLVSELQQSGRLEYLGPNGVTEPYRKHRIAAIKPS